MGSISKTEEKSKDENASSAGLDINNGEEIRDIDLDFAAIKTEYPGALISGFGFWAYPDTDSMSHLRAASVHSKSEHWRFVYGEIKPGS